MARIAYIDEAGIANPQHEPTVVVAGIIMHVDTEWRPLHDHFNGLVERFVPEGKREGFVFHAKDIWHGEGEVFDRELWKNRDRRDVLRAICETVTKFKLPIVWGHSNRAAVADVLKEEPGFQDSKVITRVAFMSAFADCAIRAELWMKKYGSNELMNLVIENNNQLRKFAKGTYRELRKNPQLTRLVGPLLPIQRIIDAPSFMDKEDAPPLQLADTCAFLIKRYFGSRNDVAEYMHKLLPSMLYAFDQGELRKLQEKLRAEKLQPE